MENLKTPAKLDTPAFLMNFPFTVDNKVANNVLMNPLSQGPYNYEFAFNQFMDLYHRISEKSLVYLLPSEGNFQDQVYVANLGCYLPHIADRDVIVVANFTSEPRIGEDLVGIRFFQSMNYEVWKSPYKWEGEADLKYLRDDIYIAGYGIRTDLEAHHWMRDNFGMNIISVKMEDPRNYHFDCLLFPLNPQKVLATTKLIAAADLAAIEGVAEVVDVPEKYLFDGWTNNVRIAEKVFHAPARTKGSEKAIQKLLEKHGLEVEIVYLWEFEKSGADLSCMLMHLN